jgi:hypothetical protein
MSISLNQSLSRAPVGARSFSSNGFEDNTKATFNRIERIDRKRAHRISAREGRKISILFILSESGLLKTFAAVAPVA